MYVRGSYVPRSGRRGARQLGLARAQDEADSPHPVAHTTPIPPVASVPTPAHVGGRNTQYIISILILIRS